jgi:hypothetical protein
MQKIIFSALFALLMLNSSCKRDWVCVCNFSDGSSPNEMSIVSSNKDAAEDTCNNFSEEAINIGAQCGLSD